MIRHRIRPRHVRALFTSLLCPALLAASAAVAGPNVFRHPSLGFEITYPDGYTVTSRERGATVQRIDDVQAMQANVPGVPNRALEIMVYSNAERLSPQEWVRRNEQKSNWSLTRNNPANTLEFADRDAITYTWCAAQCGDALVFNRGDGRSLIFINTMYADPNDPTRADMKRIASSIHFQEDGPSRQPPGGAGGGVPEPVLRPDQITILTATFGASCRAPAGNWTGLVARECNGKSRCEYLVDRRQGDPAPNCAKDFIIEWRCGNDPTLRRNVRPPQAGENYFVNVTCEVPPQQPPPPPPSGFGIEILSATFGGSCRAPAGNWTANVARECNGRELCDYRVDNRFGDPAPRCAKDFTVEWRCANDPTVRRGGHGPQGNEGYNVPISCAVQQPPPPPPSSGFGIEVLSATFGGSCRAPAGNWTATVARECNGREFCDYRVDNRFGDPAPNCAKDFTVEWRCAHDLTVRRNGHAPQGGEGYNVPLSCAVQQQPPPTGAPRITVTTATYGASCGARPGNWTEYVARECDGQRTCEFRVDRRHGDPAPRCAKDFIAEWRCPNDPNLRRAVLPPKRYGEEQVATLTCDAVVVTPPPAPQPAEPAPGEVWLYSDCNFRGRAKRINADTAFIGDDMNDKISAVKLGPGTSITLYEHANFRGRAVVLDESNSCLTDHGFNDVVSSARIVPGPQPGEVWVYSECNYQGRSKRLNASAPWLEGFNDRVSSVRLGPGTSAVLYKNRDFRGKSIAVERNEDCLRNRGFKDRASSIEIRR